MFKREFFEGVFRPELGLGLGSGLGLGLGNVLGSFCRWSY